jgi:hypothetical protein
MEPSIAAVRNSFSMRTGVARLRSLPPSVLLDLAMQRLPSAVLTTPLVHEIVHHACANSAVNIALQYRWLELLRLNLSSPGFGYAVYDDHVALAADLAATEAVFQPFAEGIANFAEFDCAVPDSKIVRTTTLGFVDALTWRLLACKPGVGSHVDDLCGLLRKEQLHEQTVARKKNILCNPVYPSSGDGVYLLGYLSVKSLWNRCVESDPSWVLRPAPFLHFVMDYFYEDWGLAQILMTPGRIQVNRVLDRLARRFEKLLNSSDLSGKAVAFVSDFDKRQRQRGTLRRGPEELQHGGFAGLDLSKEEIQQGMRATMFFYETCIGPCGAVSRQQSIPEISNLQHQILTAAQPRDLSEVSAYAKRHSVPENCAIRVLDFILEIPQNKRPYCFLLDVKVMITARSANHLILSIAGEPGSERVLPTPDAAGFDATPRAGRLFGVVASTSIPWRLYCMLMYQGKVAALWGHGDQPSDSAECGRILQTIATEMQMEEVTQLSFQSMNDYLTKNELAKGVVTEAADAAAIRVSEQIRKILTNAGWSGLMRKPGSLDFGLRNIVKGNLATLAAAGICASFSTTRPELEELMQLAGYRLQDALEMSERVKQESGVTLIRVEGNRIQVRV